MHRPRKFPTIVGLFLLACVIGGFIIAFERFVRIPSGASPTISPKSVNITNISDTSFTVSWVTDSPATGALSIANNGKNQVIFDDRGKLQPFFTHSVSFRLGSADTDYSVKILSNSKPFLKDGKPYLIRTGPTLSSPSTGLEPAYGTIVTLSGQPATDTLVYLTATGGQTLSTFVTPSGSWLVPLNLLRTQDLSSYMAPGERIEEQITIRSSDNESNAITDSLNDSPVPEMRLGKSYDFRRLQANSAPSVMGATQQGQFDVTLTKPTEGQALPTRLPLFQGTGVPGKSVSLTIGIKNPIGGAAVVAADGIWRYTPDNPIPAGKQTITATSVNVSGASVAITRMFEILKDGSQVLGDATPSATLTPTFTPTLYPTPISTLSGEPLPQSGSMLPLFLLILVGLGLLFFGFLYPNVV